MGSERKVKGREKLAYLDGRELGMEAHMFNICDHE